MGNLSADEILLPKVDIPLSMDSQIPVHCFRGGIWGYLCPGRGLWLFGL